jgi:DNA-binding transcriptional LysR family regulator
MAQKLAEQRPKLEIDLDHADAYVDLIGEGFDLAVRIGQLPDSNLGRLGQSAACRLGTPPYLAGLSAWKISSIANAPITPAGGC